MRIVIRQSSPCKRQVQTFSLQIRTKVGGSVITPNGRLSVLRSTYRKCTESFVIQQPLKYIGVHNTVSVLCKTVSGKYEFGDSCRESLSVRQTRVQPFLQSISSTPFSSLAMYAVR